MDARKFNSHMHFVNEKWAAKVLNMKINSERGPDLIDDEKAVEVKFEKVYPEAKNHRCWKFLGHQLDYDKDYSEIYWALGFYHFNKRISEIKNSNLGKLENFVDSRELYLVNWDWMKQFPIYHQKGKTQISEWDHYIGYPKFSKLPQIINQRDVCGGKIFFTDGVNPNRFSFNNMNSVSEDSCPF